jgi:hypothetical protein
MIQLIIALPYSGHYGELKFSNGSDLYLDGPTSNQLPVDENSFNLLWIYDKKFCNPTIRKRAQDKLGTLYPNHVIQFVFFENNLGMCTKNAKNFSASEQEKEEIAELSKVYRVPIGSEVHKVIEITPPPVSNPKELDTDKLSNWINKVNDAVGKSDWSNGTDWTEKSNDPDLWDIKFPDGTYRKISQMLSEIDRMDPKDYKLTQTLMFDPNSFAPRTKYRIEPKSAPVATNIISTVPHGLTFQIGDNFIDAKDISISINTTAPPGIMSGGYIKGYQF